MKNLYFIVFIVSMLLMPSCATIFLGSKQYVQLYSEPSGAEVYLNGEKTNLATPCKILVERKVPASVYNRKNEQVYSFKKENYQDAVYHDKSSFHWLAGVDFLYYVVPGLIDVAVGSHLKYQNEVYVYLNPITGKVDTVFKKEIVYVPTETGESSYVFQKQSDVDQNIPVSPSQRDMRFALIIGNEDYSSHQVEMGGEINVDFARNDASAFKEYALNVLGIPELNITFLLDATTGQMNQAVSKANKIIKNTGGKAEYFIYYAGHGLPDELTKEAYLMPVDVSGKNANEGIALKSLYERVTEFPSKRVTVFIDACFSGGARNQGLLAARGVKIIPKETPVGGSLVVFSASSDEQSSLPYKDKKHGMFTYFLLKKLKETGGNVTYNDLSEYVIQNVSLQSVLINDKEQNPKVNTSTKSNHDWMSWKINE